MQAAWTDDIWSPERMEIQWHCRPACSINQDVAARSAFPSYLHIQYLQSAVLASKENVRIILPASGTVGAAWAALAAEVVQSLVLVVHDLRRVHVMATIARLGSLA
jgi:hypothetical protein